MKSVLSFCKSLNKGLNLIALLLLVFPVLTHGQNSSNISRPFIKQAERATYQNSNPSVNFRTSGGLNSVMSATCPSSPITLAGQDTLGNAVTNGQTFACNTMPFLVYVPVVSGNIASPCVETEFTNFHTNMGTHGTETIYEGGVDVGCIGPAGGGCQFPIGQGGTNGLPWGLIFSLLDPSQSHEFVFCRNGTITTSTVTLLDCWTGAQLPSTPASSVFSNTTAVSGGSCDTMKLAAGTDLGTAAFTIAPPSATVALTDFHSGISYINSHLLGAGTYTVGYSFTPPSSSTCGTVTGNFIFTITNPVPTFSVNSGTVCNGGADTLKAVGNATTYSWTPSTGLSATTGSTVTATPTVPTTYTITGTSGACSSKETSTVTISANPVITVNSATVCAGTTATLTASGANTYTWTPSTALSSANGSTVTATPSVTTTYTVTGSVGSCSVTPDTAQVLVNPVPTLTVSSANICTAGSATLTASGATTYSWSPSTGLSTTTGSMVVANPTVTTTYTVTGTIGSCSSTGTSTLGVFSMPTFTVNKPTVCTGTPATLIASDNTLTYTWSPAATTTVSATTDSAMINPSTSTVYTITGANAGCPSLTITDSIMVIPSPTITVFSPTVCVGTTATITATGATSYTWSPMTNLTSGVTNDTVYVSNPLAPASYTVIGMAPNGCISSAVSQIDTSNHLGIVSGTPVNACFGNGIGLSAIGASTYTWTSNDPTNLDFGLDTSWHVGSTVANVGSYTVAIYGESHSGTYCVGYDTITVVVHPTPTVTTSGNASPTICAGDSVSLTVSSSGPPIVSYNWSPSTGLSTTTQSVVMASPPAGTTIYTATGTAAFGCSSSTNFTVNVIAVPSFTVNSTAFCIGNSDSLKVGAAIAAQTYSWNPATGLSATTGTAVAVTTNTAGVNSYTITGTNTLNGVSCPSMATSTVVVIALPTVTVTPTYSICSGNTATLTAGGTAVSYTWNPATSPSTGSIVTINPSQTTIYTVTGTGAVGACVNSATTTVTVNDVPNFTISNTQPVICKGDSSALAIVPTSTAAATYTWTAAGFTTSTATNVTVTPNNTTIYLVNATATVGGCTAANTTTVTVNQLPTITITPTNTNVCAGSSTNLTAANGVTYTWSPAGTVNNSTLTTVSATPTANPTTYTVIGTDGNGCVNTAMATVNITPVPVATASVNAPICKGQTINLSANSTSGNPTYIWTGPGTYTSSTQNPTIPNSTAANNGTYSLVIMDGGCSSAPSTVIVTVNPLPIVSVLPSTSTVCPGTAVTYTAAGASTYIWSPSTSLSSSTGNVVTATTNTTTVYTVIGTDANNCSSAPTTATVNVIQVAALMTANPETGDAPLDVQFTNLSTGGSSYVWNYGNGSTQTTFSLTDASNANYPNQGTYTVSLKANATAGGITCSSTYTLLVVVTEGYTIVVPNVFTPNGDGLNETFTVKGEGISTFSMDIFDRWGLKVFSSTNINTGWDGKTSGGKEMTDGTYFYLINATSSKTNKSTEYKGYLTLIR